MSGTEDREPALVTNGLSKQYGDNTVLSDVSLTLAPGEVRALMGANGAGKSTLVKILGGVVKPSGGQMWLDGEIHSPSSPAEAQSAGIAIVHQELSLVPGLTVAENITMGRWPVRGHGPLSMISGKKLTEQARGALTLLDEAIPTSTLVGTLPPAQQQLVEIAKALAWDPRILIFDEPTSSLATHEVDSLLARIRRLAEQGVSILYVSHRMDEIPKVADSVTVLRDGKEVQTSPIAEMSTRTIAHLMVGEEVDSARAVGSTELGDVALSVRGLNRPGIIDDITFDVRRGEVVGFAGLMGSGRTEVLRSIFGLDPAGGEVEVHGRMVSRRAPKRMVAASVAFTPEDRKGQGLVLGLSVAENLVMTCYDRIRSRSKVLSSRRQSSIAKSTIDSMAIATHSARLPVGQLSGGNQQKVVLGKWINRGSDILLLDEPTRGVDVNAKEQTYKTIRDLASSGAAVVFVSSEIEELFLVCDRILVLRNGAIVADRSVNETDTTELFALCMEDGADR